MASIVKKCDCPKTRWRYCKHSWVVRYNDSNGKQREKSYLHDQKRTADDYALKVEHDKRAGVFVSNDKTTKFGDYAKTVIRQGKLNAKSRVIYNGVLDGHLTSLHNRTLASVAEDRDGVKTLLLETLPDKGLGVSSQNTALAVITSVLNEAVKAGKLKSHRIHGIQVGSSQRKAEFYSPTRVETEALAAGMSDLELAAWLMRGCGLRIQETLAVRKESFMDDGTVLRASEQAELNGHGVKPLKHRDKDDYRDVPVPSYVWERVKTLPDGYLFRQGSGMLPTYRRALRVFTKARKAAGIPEGFTPHSLRHVFASVCLANGVPITDVAEWLGHKNIQVTFAIYGHLVPSAVGKARAVLDAEWAGLEAS